MNENVNFAYIIVVAFRPELTVNGGHMRIKRRADKILSPWPYLSLNARKNLPPTASRASSSSSIRSNLQAT
jgi:hypothetical protein